MGGGGNGGGPIGVCAMGARWLTQIVFVSDNGQPKLAKGQQGITWCPNGVCAMGYGWDAQFIATMWLSVVIGQWPQLPIDRC